MPEAQPQEQPAQQCPPQAPVAPVDDDRSKFTIFRDGILNTGTGVAAGIRSTDERIRTALRYQMADQQEFSVLESPFLVAGNALDATAGNIARRALEVSEPIGNAAEAAVKGTIGAVLQPIATITDPVGFLKKPIKIVTSLARAAANGIKSIIRGAHDIMERGIEKNVKTVEDTLRKIPIAGGLLGGIVGKTFGFLSKIGTKLTGVLSKIQDKIFSPVDAIDEAVKI